MLARILLLGPAAVQRIEHVTVSAGPALGIAWVQHIAHIQSTALRATGRGGGGRCHTPWLRSPTGLGLRATLDRNWRHTALVRSHRRLVGLHGRERRSVRRGRGACIVTISRWRRGASIVDRRGICVRAGGGMSLVSGSRPSGGHGSQIGWIRVLKSRIGASTMSLRQISSGLFSLFWGNGGLTGSGMVDARGGAPSMGRPV